jgi:tRNA-splicing endonuclease subunit Sen15, fungi type
MALSDTLTKVPKQSALSNLIEASYARNASESLAISVLHNLQYQHNWTDLKIHLIQTTTQPNGRSNEEASKLTKSRLMDLEGISFNHSKPPSREASPSRLLSLSQSSSSPPNQDSCSDKYSNSGSSTPTQQSIRSFSPLRQRSTSPFPSTKSIPLISGLPPSHSYIHPDLQVHLLKHNIAQSDLQIQREYVLPSSTGETWSLHKFCDVFDALPQRPPHHIQSPQNISARLNGTAHGVGTANGSVNGSAHQAIANYEHQDHKRVILGMRAHDGMGGDGTTVYYIMQEGEVKPRQNG